MEVRFENKKDHHCYNVGCPSVESGYIPYVSVREGWYFAESYHLPFQSSNRIWYSVVGPVNGRTVLKRIQQRRVSRLLEVPLGFQELNDIEYYALPANDDLRNQFQILIDKFISIEKPLNVCDICHEPHCPEDECEEEALMRGEM